MPLSRFRLSPRARQTLAKVHRWFGICIGLNASLLCITGALLIYGEDIDTYLNPQLRTAVASGPMISPARAIEVYKEGHPGVAVDRIYTPIPPLGTYRLRVGAKHEIEAFVDPYKGTFLGERVRDDTLMRKITNFHIALLWPPIGRSINGFTALAALWLLISGIFVWWPATKRQLKSRLTFKRNATPRRRVFDLHNVVGIYAAPILILALISGFLWAFEDFGDSMFALIGGKARFAAGPKAAPTGAPYLSNAELLAISQREAPDSHLVKIMVPTSTNKIAEIHREWSDNDQYGHKLLAFIDAETGKIVKEDDSRNDNFATTLSRMVRPFHRGLWAGNLSRAMWAIAGIAPLLLFVTGLIKLRQRKLAQRELEAKRAVVILEGVSEAPAETTEIEEDEPVLV